MAKVYVVLRHDYESGAAHAGEFCSPTEVVGVFTTSDKSSDYVEKRQSPGNDSPYGYTVEEHEVDEENGRGKTVYY